MRGAVFKPHSKNCFDYLGIPVVEYFYEEWTSDKSRLIWVREDISKMEINGKQNMLVHADFRRHDPVEHAAVRLSVASAFAKYWGLPSLNTEHDCEVDKSMDGLA